MFEVGLIEVTRCKYLVGTGYSVRLSGRAGSLSTTSLYEKHGQDGIEIYTQVFIYTADQERHRNESHGKLLSLGLFDAAKSIIALKKFK